MMRKLLECREYHESKRAEVLGQYSQGLAQSPPTTMDNDALEEVSEGKKIDFPEKRDRIATLKDKARFISLSHGIGIKINLYEDVFEIIFYPGKTVIFREIRYMIEHMDDGYIRICPDTGRLEIHCLLNLFQYEDESCNMLLEETKNGFLNRFDMDVMNDMTQDMIETEKRVYEKKLHARRR